MTIALHDAQMDQVLAEPKAVIKFWAPWCGPCTAFAPVVDQVAKAHADVPFYSVNIDEEPLLARKFMVRALPTIVGLKEGGVTFAHVGVVSAGMLGQSVSQMA